MKYEEVWNEMQSREDERRKYSNMGKNNQTKKQKKWKERNDMKQSKK
jgi:hypothetical protein